MDDEFLVLTALVLVMLVGSYLAGSIPLFLVFSEEKLKRVSAFGAGLLVGTALAVIIPEGVRTLGTNNTIETSAISISLVFGFIFMLLVEQVTKSRSGGSSNVATVGLVVHSAADGVALGAAATTSHADVEFIVFLAIMLHKAPAAFGLVTYLLHENVERTSIRRHLLIFSIAAPATTVITYFGIGQEQKEALHTFNATGIALLFSAGTFLYVATVHVLAELMQKTTYSKLENCVETGLHESSTGLKSLELLCLVIGCLTPLLLTMGHHHH